MLSDVGCVGEQNASVMQAHHKAQNLTDFICFILEHVWLICNRI